VVVRAISETIRHGFNTLPRVAAKLPLDGCTKTTAEESRMVAYQYSSPCFAERAAVRGAPEIHFSGPASEIEIPVRWIAVWLGTQTMLVLALGGIIHWLSQ
jgi:hypothetical protein